MSKFVCTRTVGHDGKDFAAGDKIELSKTEAAGLLAVGAVVPPGDYSPDTATPTPTQADQAARIAELEAERDGLRETVAALESQVSDLTAAADDKANAKSGGDPKLPGT